MEDFRKNFGQREGFKQSKPGPVDGVLCNTTFGKKLQLFDHYFGWFFYLNLCRCLWRLLVKETAATQTATERMHTHTHSLSLSLLLPFLCVWERRETHRLHTHLHLYAQLGWRLCECACVCVFMCVCARVCIQFLLWVNWKKKNSGSLVSLRVMVTSWFSVLIYRVFRIVPYWRVIDFRKILEWF